MKVPTNQTRVRLPQTPHICLWAACVYCGNNGVCDEPRINRANSDSKCHRVTPRVVIADFLVGPVPERE